MSSGGKAKAGGIGALVLVLLLVPGLMLGGLLAFVIFLPFGGGGTTCTSGPGVLPVASVPQPLNGLVTEAAEQWGTDPLALAVLVHNEHGWTFDVPLPPPYGNGPIPRTSEANAVGFMQFLLPTWRKYQNSNPAHQPGDIMDPKDALYAAAHYLLDLGGKKGNPLGSPAAINQEGTLLNAIVSYHSGPGFESVGLGPRGRQYMQKGYAAYLELLRAGGASENAAAACTASVDENGTIPGIVNSGTWQLPVEAGRYYISSRFGEVSPIRNYLSHRGTDFAAPEGTPVHAALGGVVTFAGSDLRQDYYGNFVIIDHGTVGGDHIITRYHVLGKVAPNLQGKIVNAGDIIGWVGKSGNSTGNHVHFETNVNGVFLNPENVHPLL